MKYTVNEVTDSPTPQDLTVSFDNYGYNSDTDDVDRGRKPRNRPSIASENGHGPRTADLRSNRTPENGHGSNKVKTPNGIRPGEGDIDIFCGIGSCQPVFLKCCKNMAAFSLVLGVASLVTSALNSYITSQITTLERHFNFSSSISGFLMSCNDLGYLLTTLFMSYYARRVHIPRAMAISTVVYGVSGILCSVAFFATKDELPPPPKGVFKDVSHSWNSTSLLTSPVSQPSFYTQMCLNQTPFTNNSCGGTSTGLKSPFGISEYWKSIAVFILALGMILQGVAKSPRHPFVITYIDDNVPKTKTAIYLGVTVGIAFFGPALAFGLGAVFNNLYITLEAVSITPRDPRWLGAWWVGFLVFGGAGLVVGLPLIFFPKRMGPRTLSEGEKPKKSVEERKAQKCFHDLKGFLKVVQRLGGNPVYVCLTLGSSINLMGASGMMSFFTKYLETQYMVTAPQASLILGILNVLLAVIGTSLGGCLTSRLKLSPMACLKFIIATKIIVTAVFSLGFATGCHQPLVHTGQAASGGAGEGIYPQCVTACNCDDQNYFPLCGSDGNSYFSPCHAGCSAINGMFFSNCSCMRSNSSQTGTPGLCLPACSNMIPYLAIISVGGFITMMAMMPSFIVSIRCVKEQDKPFAVGFGAFAGTLIGWFPGPVIFGSLVDSTCILWTSSCGSVGACARYDIDLFRVRFHALIIGLRLLTLVFYLLAWLCAACSRVPVFHLEERQVAVPTGEPVQVITAPHKLKPGGQQQLSGHTGNSESHI